MRLPTPILCTVLIALNACGQQAAHDMISNSHKGIIDFAKVDTVQAPGKNIMLIYQDRKNNYWFGSWEEGLYQYDGKTMLHFTTACGLPGNRIDEIQEDHAGNLYFATNGSILKFDGKQFIALPESDADHDWKLIPSDLWFKDGWDSRFVFRCDGDSLYKLQLPPVRQGEEYIARNPTHPNPYTVYSMYKDSRGHAWFGTGALGAVRYNGRSFDWILERDVMEIYNAPTEGANGIRSIIEDKDGYFWFNSLFRYRVYEAKKSLPGNPEGTFYSRTKSIGSLDGKEGGNLNEYLSITKDTNNALWIATYNAGVYHYDGKKITQYIVKNGPLAITLFSVYRDRAGQLWLGTQKDGAYRFNGQTFERFTLNHKQ